jgi:SAM-dependent methyltransferase
MQPIPNSCVSCSGNSLNSVNTCEGYTLYECGSCTLQFWWPFTNPGNEYYEQDKALSARNRDPFAHPLFPTQKRFLRAPLHGKGRLLDLGMGTGRFLAAAKDRGYTVTGCDFDRDAVQVARDVFHLNDVHVTDVDTYAKQHPEQQFDVITLFEVIEHLDNFDIFNTIHSLLAPGGIVVISTPNRGRWKHFIGGDFPPRHLTRWDTCALKNFLEQRRFEDITVRLTPIVFRRLLMRFSAWTAGWLSFSLTKKLDRPAAPQSAHAPRQAHSSTSSKRSLLHTLSLIKLYGLFSMPAGLFYMYLRITGRRDATALYATAVKK